jgi:hypothetical protein
MCGRPGNEVIEFAVRAIAAGAGGKELAAWAVEERERIIQMHDSMRIDFDSAIFQEMAK